MSARVRHRRVPLLAAAVAIAAGTALVVASPHLAGADERRGVTLAGTFLLQVGDGLPVGNVRAAELSERAGPPAPNLVLTSAEITPALGAILDGFVAGKALRTSVRLSTGAVVKKAPDARLVSVRLPAMGGGGTPDVELGFLAGALSTQPVLSVKQAGTRTPVGSKINDFRVELTGLPPISASKLEALELIQHDGSVSSPRDVVLEVAAGGAPPFTAWSKKPAPKVLGLEYVGADGRPLLKLRLDACTPSAVTPLGASSTTRVVLRCAAAAAAKPG